MVRSRVGGTKMDGDWVESWTELEEERRVEVGKETEVSGEHNGNEELVACTYVSSSI